MYITVSVRQPLTLILTSVLAGGLCVSDHPSSNIINSKAGARENRLGEKAEAKELSVCRNLTPCSHCYLLAHFPLPNQGSPGLYRGRTDRDARGRKEEGACGWLSHGCIAEVRPGAGKWLSGSEHLLRSLAENSGWISSTHMAAHNHL